MCHGMLIETRSDEHGLAVSGRFAGEPALRDLLQDPIALALMAADKVDRGDLCELLRKAQGQTGSTR
jgi:hypothetical protein